MSAADEPLKGHGRERAARASLIQGAGKEKILFLDAQSGVAGDMVVAALVDLGVPFETMAQAVSALNLPGVSCETTPCMAGAIGAQRFQVHESGPPKPRDHADIQRLLQEAALDPSVRSLAQRIFRHLAEAEAWVHRVPVDTVHFHEVGAVDSICDIVCAAAGFHFVGATVVCSPLPLGYGHTRSSHGNIPVPVPATVECLRLVPTYAANVEAELVTPTGAAIVATVADSFSRWPDFLPDRVGWGAGTRSLPDRPNALRAVLGTTDASKTPRPPLEGSSAEHYVIETNVDDMTGELTGHVLSLAISSGALDAWATPATMKKSRPGLVLSVLARREQLPELSSLVLRETTSLGVRTYPVERLERPRRDVQVSTPFGTVRVKWSEGPYGAPQMKPEFDDCKRLAFEHGVALRQVANEALAAAQRLRSD